ASDLRVSIISLGSWLTYSGGVEKRQALACVHKALDLGINFIDTANVYGRGAAESVLGEALHGIDRTSYMLATKVFGAMSDTDRGLSSSQIVTQLNASLKRLGTDYIDLYQCHRFDEETPLDETMEALTAAVRQGKARYIGFRAGPEKAESGGDSQAARVMIHPAGWEEASLDGKTLFAGFAGTHDVGCSFRTVSTRGGADVRCQRELCDQAHAAGLMKQA